MKRIITKKSIPEFIVDSRLRMTAESVKNYPNLVERMIQECTYENPEFAKWKIFKGTWAPPKKEICSAIRHEDGTVSFPRGAIGRLSDITGDNIIVHDKRVTVEANNVKWLGKPARRYQRKCIERGVYHKKTRSWVAGIWRARPGSGKTAAILELISEIGLNTLVICPTEGIYKQWIKRSEKELGVKPGEIQGKTCIIGDLVTIAMKDTLASRDISEIVNKFGAVIVDEAQRGAARTYQEVMDKFPALFRMAVSGNEQRSDGLEFLIYDQFGPVDVDIPNADVKAEGGVVDVDIIIVPTEFKAPWYSKLKSKYKFRKRAELLNLITSDVERNNIILDIAKSCWIEEREQVMIMTERKEHCNVLIDGLQEVGPTSLLSSNKDFEKNTIEFAEGRNLFAVGTYKAVGVGFESHPELARGIFTCPIGKDEKGRFQFSQYQGRFGRPMPEKGKTKGIVYYIYDPYIYGKSPVKLISKWMKEEDSGKVYVKWNAELIEADVWLKKYYKASKYENEETEFN